MSRGTDDPGMPAGRWHGQYKPDVSVPLPSGMTGFHYLRLDCLGLLWEFPPAKGQVTGPPGHNPFREFPGDRRRIGG
jgi:hypothetical protein